MNWLIDQLAKEWGVIKQAPISFVIVVVLSLVSAYFLLNYVYRQRLEARDDMLAYYREKLGLSPVTKTPYSGLRNSELKQQALTMVLELRALSDRSKSDMEQISLSESTKSWPSPGQSPPTLEQRKEAWEEMNRRLSQAMNNATANYERNYKVNAVFLRDEILSRLPTDKRREIMEQKPIGGGISYLDAPTNPLGLGIAADALERLAKSLSEN